MASGGDYARFRSEGQKGEEQLKSQTIGLVHLDDFRKRRAEAFEHGSGGVESASSRSPTPQVQAGGGGSSVKFKKRKVPKKGGLSFTADDEDGPGSTSSTPKPGASRTGTPSSTATGTPVPATPLATDTESDAAPVQPRRLAANTSVAAPRAQTKSALLREAQQRETLRREFLSMQERVRATEFMVPFVFYDGTDAVGGACRVAKGEQVWRFLDKARKVGARAGGDGKGNGGSDGMKTWARVSVDDLMLVTGDLVLPHHYEFYYFMLNRTTGFEGRRVFAHSAEPTAATPETLDAPAEVVGGLITARQIKASATGGGSSSGSKLADVELEGATDNPALIKVVDRRWYERNKHIFPQSIWQDFEPGKDYGSGVRKDAQGNAYFVGGGGN